MELFYLFAILAGPGLVLALLLALPKAVRGLGLWSYLRAVIRLFAGITFPLTVFFLSSDMVPEWKGGTNFGWLGGFHIGKFALTPLVLWACAAFYKLGVSKTPGRIEPWVVLGIVNGAIVSCVCAIVGILIDGPGYYAEFLLVPIYVAIWYMRLAIQLVGETQIARQTHVFNLLTSLPLWGLAISWTRAVYEKLPDTPPECFIVTAASRGTPWLVGPTHEVEHAGGTRQANLQLARFWRFEELWSVRSPRSHRCFRAIYNRLGPLLAARIRHPLAADLIYLLLKPLEWVAAILAQLRPRY